MESAEYYNDDDDDDVMWSLNDNIYFPTYYYDYCTYVLHVYLVDDLLESEIEMRVCRVILNNIFIYAIAKWCVSYFFIS